MTTGEHEYEATGLEDTLAAIRLAGERGARIIEQEWQLTAMTAERDGLKRALSVIAAMNYPLGMVRIGDAVLVAEYALAGKYPAPDPPLAV